MRGPEDDPHASIASYRQLTGPIPGEFLAMRAGERGNYRQVLGGIKLVQSSPNLLSPVSAELPLKETVVHTEFPEARIFESQKHSEYEYSPLGL